jgi:hypothetical protein
MIDALKRVKAVQAKEAAWNEEHQFLDVRTPQAFTQLSGYLKFSQSAGGPVFYRGQRKLYGGRLVPSLLRPQTKQRRLVHCKQAEAIRRTNELERYLEAAQASFLRGTPRPTWEPILQHYFLNTRWIDLVDSPWIALWFACHELTLKDWGGDRLSHFRYSKRSFNDAINMTGGEPCSPLDGYAFVLLLQFGLLEPYVDDGVEQPGFFVTRGTTKSTPGYLVTDLRVAAPSLYLRPHAQQGMLAKRSAGGAHSNYDVSGAVIGAIGIRLDRALDWLGGGHLLSTASLFPAATHDEGYRALIEKLPPPPECMGKLGLVGP